MRSVLLDLDGTVIDSEPGIRASVVAALRALGHEAQSSLDIRPFIGPPLEDAMHILLEPYGDDRVDEAVLAYRRHYGETGLFGSVPYLGIGDALAALKRTGVRLYLATSKRETFAARILEHLDLAMHFEAIHGSIPSGALDRKPELLAHIVATYALSPVRSLMVGDRHHDIAGARAVNMRGLGVLWGYGSRDELQMAGAACLVENPADLADAVRSLMQ